jgi:prevent-host-death family protein
MKTISVREMKAHCSEVESQVRNGETFEVVNRGKPTVRILPAKPRDVLKWEDHLDTSALLKLYVLESGSDAVQAEVASQSEPLPSMWPVRFNCKRMCS